MNNLSDEFLDWLNQCPNQWLRLEDTEDSITYIFYKDKNDE